MHNHGHDKAERGPAAAKTPTVADVLEAVTVLRRQIKFPTGQTLTVDGGLGL